MTAPKLLTDAQMQHFIAHGYLRLRTGFSSSSGGGRLSLRPCRLRSGADHAAWLALYRILTTLECTGQAPVDTEKRCSRWSPRL